MSPWASRIAVAVMAGARRTSLLVALVAALLVAGSLIADRVIDAREDCSGPSECPEIYALWDLVFLVFVTSAVAFLLALVSWITLSVVNRRSQRLHLEFTMRSNSHRDWFVNESISRRQYDGLKAAFDPLKAKSALDAGRAAGSWLVTLTTILLVVAALAWALLVDIGQDGADGFLAAAWTIVIVVTLAAAGGFAIGVSTLALARRKYQDRVRQANAIEEQVLASIGKA